MVDEQFTNHEQSLHLESVRVWLRPAEKEALRALAEREGIGKLSPLLRQIAVTYMAHEDEIIRARLARARAA